MKVGSRVRVVKSFQSGMGTSWVPVGARGTVTEIGPIFPWIVKFDDGRVSAVDASEIEEIHDDCS